MGSSTPSDLRTRAHRFDRPFPHVVFPEDTVLPRADVDRLINTFPDDDVMTSARRDQGSDKTYVLRTATLYEHGRTSPSVRRLDPAWRELLCWLVDSDYRAQLAVLLGAPAEPVDLEIRVSEYSSGGWMSRHTDRPEKVFSQNLYLCPGWRPEWGGGLALYSGRADHAPAATFVPGAGNSVAFARSDRSWHEVVPVAAAADRPRRAVLVHGYYRPAG